MNLTPEERADSIYHRRDEWRDIYEGTIDYEDLVTMIAGEIKGAINDMKGENTAMPDPEQTTIKDICIYCGDRSKDHVCQDKRTVMVALREDLEGTHERLICVEKMVIGQADKIDVLQKEIERLNDYITNHMISGGIKEQVDRFNTTGSPRPSVQVAVAAVSKKSPLNAFLPGSIFSTETLSVYVKTNFRIEGDRPLMCIDCHDGSITFFRGDEEVVVITLSLVGGP